VKVNEEKQEELISVLTVNLTPEDYESKVKKSLNQQARKAQIKGFRQGKVPSNLVKKMYGNSILADVINHEVNHAINDYLRENKIEVLGQPIPVPSEDLAFDIYNPSSYSFQYKIGRKPEVDISYLDSNPTYTQYEIEIADDMIQKEVDHMLENYGEVEHPDGKPEGKDAMEVQLKELDEEGNVKDGGYEHSSAFGFDQLKLKKDQTAIGKLKVGDTYAPFNVYRAFDKEKEAIAKQILELDPEMIEQTGGAYQLKLVQINRAQKGELNQEFFDKMYGEGNVKSEDEMRDKIRENLTNYLAKATENQLKGDLYKDLMEKGEAQLPESFLKEWLLVTKESEESVTTEDIEGEFPEFSKNLRSSLLFNAVAEKGEIEVGFEELREKVKSNLIEQFQYYGMPLTDNQEMLDGMIQRFMSDEKQLRQTQDQLMDEKIFAYLKENVKTKPKTVSLEAFNELNEKK